MDKRVILFLLLFSEICVAQNKKIKYQRCDVNNWYLNISVDNSTEMILDFRPEDNSAYPAWHPARIGVICVGNLNLAYPLFVTANQQTLTQSWQLPMKIEHTDKLGKNYFSRTLCPTGSDSPVNWPLVHLTTESPDRYTVQILVELVDTYQIPLANKTDPNSGWIKTDLRVNTPEYYSFRFPSPADKISFENTTQQDEALALPEINSPQNVILMLESESPACMIVSVQDLTCPVYDDEQTIRHKGDYFTMMDKGGITISQNAYPNGFYVVLYLKASDEECSGSPEAQLLYAPRQSCRIKPVRFRVIETISYQQYLLAVMVVLMGLIAYLGFVLLTYASTNLCSRITAANTPELPVSVTSEALIRNPIPEENEESELATLVPPSESRGGLMLAELCRLGDAARKSRADKFLWGILIISVFYSLPVVQLIVTYQQMAQNTGNRDLCYYNFLCAHPFGSLGDANHVFSNIGYIILGSVFLIVVRRRQKKYNSMPEIQKLGIPQHFGLYYAMGVSLLMEGILSGTYHICPNKMNFQFDSSFMYVMSVLCMVKLYQGRHPDVNAKAHATFAVLACIIFIGFSEVLFTYSSVHTYSCYWLFLCYLKLFFVLWVSCKIYYMGEWHFHISREGTARFFRAVSTGTWQPRPMYMERFVFVALINLVNYVFDIYGFDRARRRGRDVPVHLLQVLLVNTILYIIIYIFMKVKHRERVTPKAIVTLVISNALWAVSLFFFINGRTKWSWTPAHSRTRNAPCTVLDAFDTHDIWHLTSAAALFHTFLLLLTIDDDLAFTPREKIPVF